MQDNNTTRTKKDHYNLSLRKTKQTEIIGQKRQQMSKIFQNESSKSIRVVIDSKNLEEVRQTAFKLVNQFLGIESTYELTESNILTLLVDISAKYNCQHVFNSLSNISALMFFKRILENIYKRQNVEASYFLLTNIFFDDHDSVVLKYLIENCDLISIMLSHINHKLDKDLIDMNLKLISTVAYKDSICKDEDFIKKVVTGINNMFDEQGMTDAILKDGVVLAAFFISDTPHLFEINEFKLIQMVVIDLYGYLMAENDKDINLTVAIIKIFSEIVQKNDTDPRKTIDFVINTIRVDNILKLLKIPNSNITKYTLWLLTNILVDFQNQPENKVWEPCYYEISGIIEEVALREYEGLVKNAILSLQYFLVILDPTFVAKYYNLNLQGLIDYFKHAFQALNQKAILMQLDLLNIFLEKVPTLEDTIKKDDFLMEIISNMQSNDNLEIREKVANLISAYLA